jgi:hypothetical protein
VVEHGTSVDVRFDGITRKESSHDAHGYGVYAG